MGILYQENSEEKTIQYKDHPIEAMEDLLGIKLPSYQKQLLNEIVEKETMSNNPIKYYISIRFANSIIRKEGYSNEQHRNARFADLLFQLQNNYAFVSFGDRTLNAKWIQEIKKGEF